MKKLVISAILFVLFLSFSLTATAGEYYLSDMSLSGNMAVIGIIDHTTDMQFNTLNYIDLSSSLTATQVQEVFSYPDLPYEDYADSSCGNTDITGKFYGEAYAADGAGDYIVFANRICADHAVCEVLEDGPDGDYSRYYIEGTSRGDCDSMVWKGYLYQISTGTITELGNVINTETIKTDGTHACWVSATDELSCMDIASGTITTANFTGTYVQDFDVLDSYVAVKLYDSSVPSFTLEVNPDFFGSGSFNPITTVTYTAGINFVNLTKDRTGSFYAVYWTDSVNENSHVYDLDKAFEVTTTPKSGDQLMSCDVQIKLLPGKLGPQVSYLIAEVIKIPTGNYVVSVWNSATSRRRIIENSAFKKNFVKISPAKMLYDRAISSSGSEFEFVVQDFVTGTTGVISF